MRYFLELSYNGKNYYGWQVQPNQISVQEVIQDRLSKILGQEIAIVGAGRTDSGVHATKMFAHFDYDMPLNENFVRNLNSFLPKDISIYSLHEMNEDAHARFDALSRTYHYFITPYKNPFSYESSWIYTRSLNIDAMNEAAKLLLETSDFTSFAKLHTDVKTNICSVKEAYWYTNEENQLIFTISADRFLRNMVRAIVGTLVEVGLGKINQEEFKEIINNKNRNKAGASAPAQGLYLTDIKYPKDIFRNE